MLQSDQWNELTRKNDISPIWNLIGWFIFQLKSSECLRNTNLKWKDVFRKVLVFFLVIFCDWWGGPQDLHPCMHKTVAKSKEKTFASLSEEPCSFLLILRPFLHDHAWLGVRECCFRVQILPCLRIEFFYLHLAHEKHCTHIVSVMWPESFELIFLGSYNM